MKPTRGDRRAMLAFMLPALALLLAFFVIPVLYVFAVSFLKWSGLGSATFRGLRNYALIFADKAFRRSILNNVIWALLAAGLGFLLAQVGIV